MNFLTLLSSILLGVVQGVTEFLPVSSSGHLAIAEHLLNVSGAAEVPPFFDVLLHLGTLFAVFIAYWEDIRDMVLEFFCGVSDLVRGTTPSRVPPARRMILLIIVGTLPLFAVLPVKDAIEALGDNMYFVAFALLGTGCLLFASDHVRRGRKTEKTATMLDALLVGVGQALATCPGISRSGTTITAGCFVGFDRKFAVRYSFLMSIPAILGANILSLKDALETQVLWEEVPIYLVGVAVSALVGYLCIRLIKLVADKGKFGFFAYYCWLAGIVTLALIFTQK
nr:undecaprenyl-diphosphate phosphatase [uncultured Oscillibacter sp.]